MTCPTRSSLPMVATSRYEFICWLPVDCQLTQSGRVRSKGGRERRHSGWHTVLALEKLITSKLLKPGANKRIATVDRNMGIVRANGGPASPPLTRHSRSPQVCFPTAAISCRELAMRQHSGGKCTRHRSPHLPSPIAWAATLKHTLFIPACDLLA
jgi:hypothetical protein